MSAMVVHTLQFSDRSQLTRSFQRLTDSEDVEDCIVEADQLRLRFLAPEKLASALVERLYLDGGLTWCSRHALVSEERPTDEAPSPPA